MSKVPSLEYRQVVNALKRDGWVVVRQKGSHSQLKMQIVTSCHGLTQTVTQCFALKLSETVIPSNSMEFVKQLVSQISEPSTICRQLLSGKYCHNR